MEELRPEDEMIILSSLAKGSMTDSDISNLIALNRHVRMGDLFYFHQDTSSALSSDL